MKAMRLPLPVRDRAIQRFAEKDERGASLLICGETGVGGRCLSFAHHLVLFDLPPDPLKIEKRIGSLDRFGHMAKVRVHVPCVEGTPAEVYFRWFHEALHAFERPLPVVHACGREFAAEFRGVAAQPADAWPAALDSLLPAGLTARLRAAADSIAAGTLIAAPRPASMQALRPLRRRPA